MGEPLKSLTVRGFKSIRNLENFELGNLNVLIGANGSGKSNFLEIFSVISAMTREGGLKEYVAGSADSFLVIVHEKFAMFPTDSLISE